MSNEKFQQWATQAKSVRSNILKMIHQCASGHPGGSLSLVEILMALHGRDGVMKLSHIQNKEFNDRLVLSKGHGVPALYAVMAELGLANITSEELMTLRHLGSRLQGHPDRNRIPELEACTGSLGQGLSIAQGMAMSYKLDHNPHRIYCIVGDGEMQEGQIWEVALSAPHHKVDNLTLILDYNKGQIDGFTSDVLNLDPLRSKWEAFGWLVHEIDGHNYEHLTGALSYNEVGKPTMIIAHTIKGKGVSFMEHDMGWHGVAPNAEQLTSALEEITQSTPIGY